MTGYKTITSKLAAQLDADLMGPKINFTLQQLMELAGLSVAETVQKEFPKNVEKNILVLAGPGNNGGDGLVCARHLKLFGFKPIVFYPVQSKRTEFYSQLVDQLKFFNVPLIDNSNSQEWLKYLDPNKTLCIIDALFGFSFKPPLREPFTTIIEMITEVQDEIPVVAVDVPSGWDVDNGPPKDNTKALDPKILVSLTVPKPCSAFLHKNSSKHYVGGRFIPKDFANKFGFEPFPYNATDQVLQLD